MRKQVVAVALALVAASSSSAVQAEAEVVAVQAGALHPSNAEVPFEYARFYPEALRVHRGQTVEWTFVGGHDVLGFHTVTFSTDGKPSLWRTDDVPGTYAIPERFWFGTGCGRGVQPACVLTAGAGFVSSGTPPNPPRDSPFRVVVDAPPGTYSYFCAVHPAMEGSLTVVPDHEAIPTQAEIDTLVQQQIADDTLAADARLDAGQTPRRTVEDGIVTWTVLLGDSTDDDHVSVDSYLPAALSIEPGDRVRFEFRDRAVGPIINEIHTVTFPAEVGVQGAGVSFYPACDHDDPSTGAKGIPGAWGFIGPPCPFNAEMLWQERMTETTAAPGNAVLTPATFHDSGLLVPVGAPDDHRRLPDVETPLPASFVAEFPVAGTFAFGCSIHETLMTGSIVVG